LLHVLDDHAIAQWLQIHEKLLQTIVGSSGT
jgi:hypothetical protein